MPMLITCSCGKKLKVREELAGRKVKCPACADAITVPASEPEEKPVELLEMVEEEKPRTLPAKSSRPPSAERVKLPAPVWENTKKPVAVGKPKRSVREEDEPTPFWIFPGTLSSEVMALARDGLYFASLKGDALKRAEKLMRLGSHPAEALGDKTLNIPWDWVISIYSNKRLRGFDIHYTTDDGSIYKSLDPTDQKARDELFEAVAEYLAPDWAMTTKHVTPIGAMVLPLGFIGGAVALTAFCAYIGYILADEGELQGRGRGAVIAAILNALRWLGPAWIGVIGLCFALMFGIWLIVRILLPPIEISIQRRPDAPQEEDDDEEA